MTPITRTGLFSSIQSSRHSGNSVLCSRSVPSTKRFIRPSAAAKNQRCENHTKEGVFTQPGSKADRLAVNIFRLEYPQEQTSSRHSGTSEKCNMYGPAVRYKLDFRGQRS